MLEQIRDILAESTGAAAEDIVPEASLAEDLDIDSLAAVELALALEDAFGIEIPDEELTALNTVQDVLNLVEKLKQA